MSKTEDGGLPANSGRQRSKWLRAGFLVVSVALVWSVWSQVELQSRMGALEETSTGEISDLREAVSKIDPTGQTEPAGRVPQALIRNRLDSVYLVSKGTREDMERPMATAWVIADGILATNAHVAEEFDKSGKYQLFVRNSSSSKNPNRVVKIKLHAGYEEFAQAVEDYRPFLATPDGTPYGLIALKGYDVALLYVERPEDLAPPIPVASRKKLESLTPGDPLVQIGFPLRRVYNFDLQPSNPNPRVQHGHITAMTHFLQGRVPTKHAHMVVHNVPSTGGNSGSPMLNVNGEVVSLESYDLGFYGESGAQRADLALELLEEKDLSKVRTIHRPQWNKLLKNFKSGHEIIPWSVVATLEEELGKVTFTQDTERFSYDRSKQDTKTFCFEGAEPKHIIGRVLKELDYGPQVQFLASEPSLPAANRFADKKCPEDTISHKGIWHSKTFTIDRPGPYLLYAYDYSIEGPCSRVQIIGKPADATVVQFVSTSGVHHSYAVVGVPEEVKALEVHYLVELQFRSRTCGNRKGKGKIDIGLVHFEKAKEAEGNGTISNTIAAATTGLKDLKVRLQSRLAESR